MRLRFFGHLSRLIRSFRVALHFFATVVQKNSITLLCHVRIFTAPYVFLSSPSYLLYSLVLLLNNRYCLLFQMMSVTVEM